MNQSLICTCTIILQIARRNNDAKKKTSSNILNYFILVGDWSSRKTKQLIFWWISVIEIKTIELHMKFNYLLVLYWGGCHHSNSHLRKTDETALTFKFCFDLFSDRARSSIVSVSVIQRNPLLFFKDRSG